MSDGCYLHDTCFRCGETNWGFPDCPNYILKGEAMRADDARLLGRSYRERSALAASAREERVRKGRAFRKARKPKGGHR